MDSPFFTVIIPTYNRAALIRRSIKSVIEQTFQLWELIIVDDGSFDNTQQVVKEYTDKRIRYIWQTNQERSASRNLGIKSSNGQYICFLDSDDYYLPQHLESFHKKIVAENHPIAVLYCDTFEDLNGKLTQCFNPPIASCNAMEWVVQMTLGAPRTCTHRSILEKFQFNPAITVGEDVDLWVRVLKEFPGIYNDDCTVVFVSHDDRTVAIQKEDSFIAHVRLMERIIKEDGGKNISSRVGKLVISNAYLRLTYHYIHAHRKAEAFQSAMKSFLIYPTLRTKEKMYLMLTQAPIIGEILSK